MAANWNPNFTPESSDIAVITNDGNYTVVLDVDTTVGGLVLGVTNGNNLPTLLIDSNILTLWGSLTNYGTVSWGNADIYCDGGPQIYNYGLWISTSDHTLYGGNPGTVFYNFGGFRQVGASYLFSTLDNNVSFNNSGTVDVQIGRLFIYGGSGGGRFNTATGASIKIDGYVLTGNPVFTGPAWLDGSLNGSNAVLQGALTCDVITLSGTLTIASNTLFISTYGDVTIAGVLTNYGTMVWSNASLHGISGPQIDNYGLWEVAANNTFSGGNPGTVFNNFGVYRLAGDSYLFSMLDNNVSFNNSGTVDVQIGRLFIYGGSGGGGFNTATGASIKIDGYVLTGNPVFTGPAWLDGSLNGSNAMLQGALTCDVITLSGTLTIASNTLFSSIDPFASVTIAGVLTNYGTMVWSNANLDGISGPQIDNYGLWEVAAPNTFSGGNPGTVFNNFGVYRQAGASYFFSTLDNNVNFNNSGTVDVQTGGLSIMGSYTLAGGSLNFGINNSNNFGSIFLAGNATLTGTVSANLNHNYAPVAGASFPVLTYGSESGSFTSLKLPGGLAWQINYGATVFTLSVSAVLPAQLSVTKGGDNTISFAWNTIAGQTYQVQYTTNLVSLDWINLGDLLTTTNDTMTASDTIHSDLQRFYRVVLMQ